MADHLKKIGLFGGTFNPIHKGHLHLASEFLQKADLDEIWFIPASMSPFKLDHKMPTGEERLKMVALAIEGHPSFRLIDYEVKKGGISYTIDTLRTLLAEKKEYEKFYLCIAEDSLTHFSEWKSYKEILSMVPVLVGKRGEKVPFKGKIIRVDTELLEVSGTEIRERIKKRLACDHLLPQKVLDFIYENQLYFNG